MTHFTLPAALAVLATAFAFHAWMDDDSAFPGYAAVSDSDGLVSTDTSSQPTAVAAEAERVDAAADPQVEGNRHARERERHAAASAMQWSPAHPLRLTTVREDKYAMHLDGGASRATLRPLPPGKTHEPPADVVRKLRGIVRDEHGEPVAGAIVLASTMLRITRGDLWGQAGDTTAADGSFTLDLRSEKAFTAVAVHRKGWSRVALVPEGSKDHRLELEVEAPGFIRGRLLRKGEPVSGQVQITTQTTGQPAARILNFAHPEDDGVFTSSPLPAGQYFIAGHAGEGGVAGAPRAKVRDIVVEPGGTADRDIDLPIGAKIELLPDLAKAEGRFLIAEVLYGKHEVTDLASYEAARVWSLSNGGRLHLFRLLHQKDDPWVFEDAQPGEMTACLATYADVMEDPTALGCATFELADGQDFTTVEVPAPKPVK